MGSTFVAVDGCAIHVRLDGPADGPVLLFSNSLGTDLRIWDPIVDAVSDTWRCVRMDKRGHGLSQLGLSPLTMDRFAADGLAVLDHLNVERAGMVGVSIGGMIAQAVYHAAPERITCLFLCDTADRIGTPEMWDMRVDALTASGLPALADEILERWFAPSFHRNRPLDLQGYRSMLTRTPLDGYLAACRALRDADYTDRTGNIAVPTTVLCGAEDGATTPELVSAFAARIPGARYEELEDVGHLPSIEAPQHTVTALKRLLTEVGHG